MHVQYMYNHSWIIIIVFIELEERLSLLTDQLSNVEKRATTAEAEG